MKQITISFTTGADPAAFGRLCVETLCRVNHDLFIYPAAFGRLCVETFAHVANIGKDWPAAFGRLCVETA